MLALVHRTGNGSFVAPGPGNYQCATQQIGQDDLQRSPGQDPTVCGRNRKQFPVVTELSSDWWEKGNIRYIRFLERPVNRPVEAQETLLGLPTEKSCAYCYGSCLDVSSLFARN